MCSSQFSCLVQALLGHSVFISYLVKALLGNSVFISHLVKALLGHAYLTLGASIARSWCVHLTSEQEALFSVLTFLSGADIANAGSVCSLYTWFRHCYITVCLVSGASIVRWFPTG